MSKRTRATIFKVVRPWKAKVQAKRRKDAEVRQSAYSKLTDKQKLEINYIFLLIKNEQKL